MAKPKLIYRKDYKPCEYLISTTELNFEILVDCVVVATKISFYKNPKVSYEHDCLFLNGVDLELISILKDGKKTPYKLYSDGLCLSGLTNKFILDIKTRIYPQKNTSLSGLYKTGTNICSQCEAHGFRRITYYLDRPDVLSVFTTSIKADYKHYPVLLSNGNLLSKNYVKAKFNGKLVKYAQVKWHDPHPKPCYLFALVAGNFAVLEDLYTTKSGNKVALKIYVEPHNIKKTNFAMQALKKSFAWDEKRFGLECDLHTYMLVAVDDFNMGAMENKGLNIFNSACILADSKTATDNDFIDIEATIGHEYFHNWTGNRVTCRDWFQLSLKEGLTVFREQEFTADLHSRAIKRIDDVLRIRNFQFAEDSGPMAHPVRPESYIEMDNFYTFTVYEKGAEVIRMMHTFLGEDGFQKGIKLYFERHDKSAVTIDDFVSSMSDANDFDFTQFMLWYCQKGTPLIIINSSYDADTQTYKLNIRQENEHAYHLPINYALFNSSGQKITQGLLIVDDFEQTYQFENLVSKPIPSLLRGFSAPVKLNTDLSLQDRIFLIGHDDDAFSCWDNSQELWLTLILNPHKVNEDELFKAFAQVLINKNDVLLVCRMLTLPAQSFMHLVVKQINVVAIKQKKELVINKIIKNLGALLLDTYTRLNTNAKYRFTKAEVGRRALKNLCLYYLVKGGNFNIAYEQFKNANCMSDRLASFKVLLDVNNPYKDKVIAEFFDMYKKDTQVMDKWFAIQAAAAVTDVSDIYKLMQHNLFNYSNPNRLYSVLGSFTKNFVQFHNNKGYELLTTAIIKLDAINPQVAARLVSVYNHWRRYQLELSELQKQQLEKILAITNLSNGVFEIISATLK